MGRVVNQFEAFLQTAMDIVTERPPSKKEHQGASRALEVRNTETMLQLGMVADAARFIRFVDNERFDLAELPRQADALRGSAAELFLKEACLTFDGFTKQMVALTRRPRLVALSGGRPKTLGDASGPDKDIVVCCICLLYTSDAADE